MGAVLGTAARVHQLGGAKERFYVGKQQNPDRGEQAADGGCQETGSGVTRRRWAAALSSSLREQPPYDAFYMARFCLSRVSRTQAGFGVPRSVNAGAMPPGCAFRLTSHMFKTWPVFRCLFPDDSAVNLPEIDTGVGQSSWLW